MFELIQHSFHHRHFWRRISFSELSELYVSIMLRVMALSLVGIFIPIYLYQLGNSLTSISVYYTVYYGARLIIDPFTQKLIIGWGAKHILRISYLLLIIGLGIMLLLKDYNIPILYLSLIFSLATSAFYMPFHLEFSLLKSTNHEGAQLGWMFGLEKLSGALGPLVGGLVASFIGIEYVIFAAIVLLIAATVPLFLHKETIKTRKLEPLRLRDFWRYKQHALAMVGRSTDLIVVTLFWPLFIGLFILDESNVYAGLGLVITISLISAIAAAYAYGKLIDKRRGGLLLRYTSVASSLINAVRPFISSFSSVLVLNPFAEAISNGLGMAYSKGFYDASDEAGHKRMSFVTVVTAYAHVARAGLWALLTVLTLVIADKLSLQLIFVVSALLVLLLNTQKYKALR